MLKNDWIDLQDGVSEIDVSPINKIAQSVIELEKNGTGSSIILDTEMSDTSENAVQNKVIKSYVDSTKIQLQAYLNEQILGGAW